MTKTVVYTAEEVQATGHGILKAAASLIAFTLLCGTSQILQFFF